MTRSDSGAGRLALCIAHCVGLLDLTALPLWIAALVQHHGFDAQQAGALVTLFLIGGVVASVTVAPRFTRFANGRWLAATGFAIAAVVFYLTASAQGFAEMAVLHATGGLAIGAALSMTHGTVARSSNPHRLYAICGIAQGIFAIIVMASMPALMERHGPTLVFQMFAGVTLVGAVVAALLFPPPNPQAGEAQTGAKRSTPIPRAVWGGVLGLALMSMVQSMTFAFMERSGADRGFSVQQVGLVLLALGIVNLFPSPAAVVLERRLPTRAVLLAAPLMQAMLAATLFMSATYLPYAIAASMFVAVILFAHPFGFGLLARLDPSGRILAATPAMMMTGAALGPVLGGTLVKLYGYPAVGVAACIVAALSILCFSRLPRIDAPLHPAPTEPLNRSAHLETL